MAVELHDTTVPCLRWESETAVVQLAAVVHCSVGSLGVDAGESWEQDGELKMGEATIHSCPRWPLLIFSGSVQVAGDTLENLFPLPFDRVGPVSIRLSGAEGVFSATADRLVLTLKGSPRNVEPFCG